MADCLLQEEGIFSGWEVRGLAYGGVSSFHLLNICNKFTFPEFPSLKLVSFTLSFLLSAAQLVIIALCFSYWFLSFFSSLLLCDVALARNTFPFFQTKKKFSNQKKKTAYSSDPAN